MLNYDPTAQAMFPYHTQSPPPQQPNAHPLGQNGFFCVKQQVPQADGQLLITTVISALPAA